MGFFTNPWAVGIIGGVISGVFTSWITRAVFSQRENREYFQSVAIANKEVVASIKSGIPEDVLPKSDLIQAMISSTARKYNIDAKSMYSPKEVGEDLLKEIMDSGFISSKIKQDYWSKLTPLVSAKKVKRKGTETKSTTPVRNSLSLAADYVGLLTALTILTFSVASQLWSETSRSFIELAYPILASMFAIALVTVVLYTYVRFRRQRIMYKSNLYNLYSRNLKRGFKKGKKRGNDFSTYIGL